MTRLTRRSLIRGTMGLITAPASAAPHASNGDSGGKLPSGVTLQAIDGERMTSSTTMTNDYYARNGFTYATNNPSYPDLSYDNPSFFPLQCYYGIYIDVISQFRDLHLNVTNNSVLRGPDFTAMVNRGITLICGGIGPGGGTSLESPVGNYMVGIHMDEGDPATTIPAMGNSIQDNRFWDMGFTAGAIQSQSWYTEHSISALMSNPGYFTTPNGTKRGIDSCALDFYFFAGSIVGSQQYAAGNVVLNPPQTWGGTPLSVDQMARGSNYGNLIDWLRAWTNGHDIPPGGAQAAGRIPLTLYVENANALLPEGRRITPQELQWAVWSGIIHGARSIDYFTVAYGHNGGFDNTTKVGGVTVYNQAKQTNGLITSLAPVLRSPFALGFVSVDPLGYQFPVFHHGNWLGSGIEVMAKWYQGGAKANYGPAGINLVNGFYIFATTKNSETITNVSATFRLLSASGHTTATVVGENRTISIVDGIFRDTFPHSWTVHIYQIS
jgi:hypothetical protein